MRDPQDLDSLQPDGAKPRLFLTGGSGYVGRNLIRHFVGRGVAVVALARSPRAADTVRALGAQPFEADLLDASLAEGLRGCDALVHAAADTDHGRGTKRQARTNHEGTLNVFRAARAAGVRRAVHISSESVLLDGKPLVNATEDQPFPRRPAGAYSRTKGDAERAALGCAALGFSVVAVRPRFVWGRDDTTALPQLVAAATSGKLAWIDGGKYLTSTTHIGNLCEGIERALAHGASGESYFISDGESIEFRAFISRLLGTQRIEAADKRVPLWLVRGVAALGGAVERLSAGRIKSPVSAQELATSAVEVTLDISKARNALGYSPVITRSQGLAELHEAYRPLQ